MIVQSFRGGINLYCARAQALFERRTGQDSALDRFARLTTIRPMSKELQAEIKACIDKHTVALASELAELFRENMVKQFERTLDDARQETAPAAGRAKKLPRKKTSKKKSPAVARAKRRSSRKRAKPEVAQKQQQKKSRAQHGEDIVEFIRKNPGCGAADVMKGLGIRQSTWMHAKLAVQKKERIRMTGTPREARYFVTDTIVRRPAA